jgi:hypothetical protein
VKYLLLLFFVTIYSSYVESNRALISDNFSKISQTNPCGVIMTGVNDSNKNTINIIIIHRPLTVIRDRITDKNSVNLPIDYSGIWMTIPMNN